MPAKDRPCLSIRGRSHVALRLRGVSIPGNRKNFMNCSRVTLGPRLDIFLRESRAGFAQFGNEISKFEAACGQVSIGRERGVHLRENVATFDKNAGHQKGNKQRQAEAEML